MEVVGLVELQSLLSLAWFTTVLPTTCEFDPLAMRIFRNVKIDNASFRGYCVETASKWLEA